MIEPGDRLTDPQVLEGVDAMGRGRQKAKQMKVARRLKYSVQETDLEALQRELSGTQNDEDSDFESNPYAVQEEEPDDYWDESSWVAPGSR